MARKKDLQKLEQAGFEITGLLEKGRVEVAFDDGPIEATEKAEACGYDVVGVARGTAGDYILEYVRISALRSN